MVDYFALIAPTIESLSKSTVEERRQVYDRLIKMLEAQLRSAETPRSEIDILRERIDLEAAIRRVERRIQAGQIAVGSPLNPDALRPVDEQMALEPPPIAEKIQGTTLSAKADKETVENGDATPVERDVTGSSPVEPEPKEILPLNPQVVIQPTVSEHTLPLASFRFPDPQPDSAPNPRPTDWASLVPQPRPVERAQGISPRGLPRAPQTSGSAQFTQPPSSDDQSRRQTPSVQPPSEPSRRQASPPISQVTTSIQPQAPRSPQPQRELDPGRPIFGQRGPEPRQPASRLADLPSVFRSMPGAISTRSSVQPSGDLPPDVTTAGEALSQPLHPRRMRESDEPSTAYTDPSEFLRSQMKPSRNTKRRETIIDTQGNDSARPTVSIGDRPRASMLPTRGSGGWQRIAIIASCVVTILGGIAMTAYLLRDDPAEFKNATGKYAATEKPAAEEKIADRLAAQTPVQNSTPAKTDNQQQVSASQQGNITQVGSSAPTPDANGILTQKAMLFMEGSDQSTQSPPIMGRVTWKLETLKSAVANASEIGSRATVDIAEAGLTAALVFRRNRDPQSANSHMIEVTFSLADNNTTGKVRDIRVPELRGEEASRGTSLSGIPVPVTENVFLVGLNALSSEMQKNLDLLRSQNWFAMPLRFANGKRGILMFEKGKTGERVMEDAMQAWKSN